MTRSPEELLKLREGMTEVPYEASDPGDYGDYGGKCVVVLGDDRRRFIVLGETEEAIADAKAIAAVPELFDSLEALIAERDRLRRWVRFGNALYEHWREHDCCDIEGMDVQDALENYGIVEAVPYQVAEHGEGLRDAWDYEEGDDILVMTSDAREALSATQEGGE